MLQKVARECEGLDFRVQWVTVRRFRIFDPQTGGELDVCLDMFARYQLEWGDGQAKVLQTKEGLLRDIETWRRGRQDILSERPMDVRRFRAKGDA